MRFFVHARSYLKNIGFFPACQPGSARLALLILLLSAAQAAYRLSLPTEEWSFARDATGTGRRLVLERNLSGLSSDRRKLNPAYARQKSPALI
jgi:hypothetical protein